MSLPFPNVAGFLSRHHASILSKMDQYRTATGRMWPCYNFYLGYKNIEEWFSALSVAVEKVSTEEGRIAMETTENERYFLDAHREEIDTKMAWLIRVCDYPWPKFCHELGYRDVWVWYEALNITVQSFRDSQKRAHPGKKGRCYCWLNADKREYLSPFDFDYSGIGTGVFKRDNSLLKALRELLADEWKGNRIIWMGDVTEIPAGVAPVLLEELQKQTEEAGFPGDFTETMNAAYRNVSVYFKAAERIVRPSIGVCLEDLRASPVRCSNEYGIDPGDPYAGLFQKQGRSFRYTINRTKGIAYCLDTTRILYPDGKPCKADPLPFLLACGMTLPLGAWLGDVIDVADEIDASVRLLEEIIVRQ